MLPVVCEGDIETFLPCSDEHDGGTYAIRPSGTVLNAFVRVAGKRMICRGQSFPGHCMASAGGSSQDGSGLRVCRSVCPETGPVLRAMRHLELWLQRGW